MSHRTRIKICGLTRLEDLKQAVSAGADAIGLVFYPQSTRYIAPADASMLLAAMPPFVTAVGLFVNVGTDELKEIIERAPVALLQFHGDESPAQCAELAQAVNRPFIRAIRVKEDMNGDDLLKYRDSYASASHLFAGLLLDTFVDGYGGSGKVFDWSLIPEKFGHQVVLSGGLNVHNATEAVTRVRPFAVDVSSGVELGKGLKDALKIRAFVDAVRRGDATPS